MFEVFYHRRKELFDELIPQTGLHLVQEVIAIYQFVVVIC